MRIFEMTLAEFRKYHPERQRITGYSNQRRTNSKVAMERDTRSIVQIAQTGYGYNSFEFEYIPFEHVTLVVKPTYDCNLKCAYCYERDVKGKDRMTVKTVEQIAKVFSSAKGLSWIWFGGEPLMMGKDFYREANPIIKSIVPKVSLEMQSNGTLIDQDWTKLFEQTGQKFPGISFDGTKNEESRGSPDSLTSKIRHLRGQPAGALSVVTADNISNIINEYEYAKEKGYHPSFNLIFDPGYDTELMVDKELTLDSMRKFFIHWAEDVNGIQIPNLRRYLVMVLGNKHTICTYGFCPGRLFGVEPNGDVYPCGRTWDQDQCYGNIFDFDSVYDIVESPKFLGWKEKCQTLTESAKCGNCRWNKVCNSGCFNVNYLHNKNLSEPDPITCYVNKGMLDFIYDYLQTVDPYSNLTKYNPYFLTTLINNKFLSPLLIEETISRYGVGK